MKSFILVALMILPAFASAKTLHLSGVKAKALFDAFNVPKLSDFFDAAMGGKSFLAADSVECSKEVTDSDDSIEQCRVISKFSGRPLDVLVTSNDDDREDRLAAQNIRFALRDLTHQERLESPSKKVIKIQSLDCKSTGSGHTLDAIEIEIRYTCDLRY